jgi:hypothetical protein
MAADDKSVRMHMLQRAYVLLFVLEAMRSSLERVPESGYNVAQGVVLQDAPAAMTDMPVAMHTMVDTYEP